MFSQVLSFWFSLISRWVSWLFTLKINENPDISIGTFLLSCAFIGVVLYFILGTDFFPGSINTNFSLNSKSNSTDNNGYQPRHARKE